MRVWTNGKAGRVWVGETVYRVTGKKAAVEGWAEPTPMALESMPDEVVAWTPSGKARHDEALRAAGLEVLDATALDESTVAAVVADGRKPPRLVVGAPDGSFETSLPLKAKGNRVEWPEGLVWKGKPPYTRATIFKGGERRGIRVHSSAHGVAVAAAASGQVAVLRPGASELSFVLRVPGQEEARLDAVPTKEGALVTLVVEGRQGAVLHVAEDGAILGVWPDGGANGCIPALPVKGDRVVAFDEGRDALVLLDLPKLGERDRQEMPVWIVEAAVSPDGAKLLLSDAKSAFSCVVKEKGLTIAGPIALKGKADAPPVEEKPVDEEEESSADDDLLSDEEPPVKVVVPSAKYLPKASSGPARVAFPSIKRPAPPWTAEKGEDFVLPVLVRSAGLASHGIVLALSGDAVAKGLVEGVRVVCGSHETDFRNDSGVYRAILPDVDIPRGVSMPLDPKPKGEPEKLAAEAFLVVTHIDIELHCRGVKAGAAILSVVVAAEKSSAAPLKWMRPITVK